MLETHLSKVMEYFPNQSKSCLKNVLILTLSILIGETINLYKLKGTVSLVTGNTETDSHSNYKRLIRIFDNYAFSRLWLELLQFCFRLLRLEYTYLLLDGTSWKSGEKWYHYITLCIVYKGVGIPIYWEDLNKHGTSGLKERKRLMTKALRFFDISGKTLIADREYIGKDWFKFLLFKHIDFVIRLKANIYKTAINEAPGQSYEEMKAKVLRSKLRNKAVKKTFLLEGMRLQVVMVKNPKKDPKEPIIYLITNLDYPASGLAAIYPIRWKIEHCFKNLKSNGFCLEQINLQSKSRCRLLMAIMVFAYVFSIHEGLKKYKRIPMKSYKNRPPSKAESVFRNGIDEMMKFCSSLKVFLAYICKELIEHIPKYRSPNSINV